MVGWASDLGHNLGKAMTRMGIDITSVKRLQGLAERRPRALTRLFTANEVADAGSGRQRWARLAARFAAKEAIIKAAEGLHGGAYRDIEVRRRPGGPPGVSVSGPLRKWLQHKGYGVFLSLSHEDEFAVALAVLEGKEGESSVARMDS